MKIEASNRLQAADGVNTKNLQDALSIAKNLKRQYPSLKIDSESSGRWHVVSHTGDIEVSFEDAGSLGVRVSISKDRIREMGNAPTTQAAWDQVLKTFKRRSAQEDAKYQQQLEEIRKQQKDLADITTALGKA